MADNVENIVIEHLRALRSEVQTLRTEMHAEFKDVKLRLSGVESAIVSMKHEGADMRGDYVRQQVSIDNIVERLQRIEKRLELA
jgi:predicted  nucleic acid-binding Zn-ribbon protein